MNFDYIPEEVLLNILGDFSPYELITFCETYKQGYRLCRDENLWIHLYLQYYSGYPKYEETWYQSFKYLTTIQLIFKSRAHLVNQLISKLRNIYTLVLQNQDNMIIESRRMDPGNVYTLISCKLTMTVYLDNVDGYDYLPSQNYRPASELNPEECKTLVQNKTLLHKGNAYIYISEDEMQLLRSIFPHKVPSLLHT